MKTTVHIGDLKVPVVYLSSAPNWSKIKIRKENYAQDSLPIVVDQDNILCQGYLNLLIHLEHGDRVIPCYVDKYAKQPMTNIEVTSVPALQSLLKGSIRAEEVVMSEYKKVLEFTSYSPLTYLVNQQGGKCYICGRRMTSGFSSPVLSMKVPKHLGGSGDMENNAAACCRCNQLKGYLADTDDLLRIIKAQRDEEDRRYQECQQ